MNHGAFGAFEISASGLTAQRQRLDAISENIANAQTTRSADGKPYARQSVRLVEAGRGTRFSMPLGGSFGLARTSPRHRSGYTLSDRGRFSLQGGVDAEVVRVEGSRLVYQPGHPDADENGMVAYPNVSMVQEMIEMILASRAYEANVTAIQSSKAIIQSALEI